MCHLNSEILQQPLVCDPGSHVTGPEVLCPVKNSAQCFLSSPKTKSYLRHVCSHPLSTSYGWHQLPVTLGYSSRDPGDTHIQAQHSRSWETIKAIVFLLTQSTLPESRAAVKQNANHASWKHGRLSAHKDS